jgi:microcystin-dependent protein
MMGQKSGSDSVTMTTQTMPTHAHALTDVKLQQKLSVTTTGGSTNEPGSGEFGIGAGGSFPAIFSDSKTIGNTDFIGGVQPGPPVNTTPMGGNIPLDITNPCLGVNFCINLYGIFPSQS